MTENGKNINPILEELERRSVLQMNYQFIGIKAFLLSRKGKKSVVKHLESVIHRYDAYEVQEYGHLAAVLDDSYKEANRLVYESAHQPVHIGEPTLADSGASKTDIRSARAARARRDEAVSSYSMAKKKVVELDTLITDAKNIVSLKAARSESNCYEYIKTLLSKVKLDIDFDALKIEPLNTGYYRFYEEHLPYDEAREELLNLKGN